MASDIPTGDHSHLWNDLPAEERNRLHPYQIEMKILHLWQAKQMAIRAHRRHMQELNTVIGNCQRALREAKEKTDAAE